MSEPTVRDATAEDAAAVARIHLTSAIAAYRDIFPDDAPAPTYDQFLTQWAGWLRDASGPHRNLLAVWETAPAGVARVGADPADHTVGHLSRFYVDPTRWGRGIGAALYRAAIDDLRAAGFTTATLWVLEGNSRARSWYERLGWQATGERKAVFAPARIDDVQYRLEL